MTSNEKTTVLTKLWRTFMGVPEPQTHYFRTIEDAEIAIDWARRTFDVTGRKVERASDKQAFWIRHLVRAQRKEKTIIDIDDV